MAGVKVLPTDLREGVERFFCLDRAYGSANPNRETVLRWRML